MDHMASMYMYDLLSNVIVIKDKISVHIYIGHILQ